MMPWGNHFGMGPVFGWLFMLFCLMLLVMGVGCLLKMLGGGSFPCHRGGESAEEIVKKRYARGEISKEELAESLAVLRQ